MRAKTFYNNYIVHSDSFHNLYKLHHWPCIINDITVCNGRRTTCTKYMTHTVSHVQQVYCAIECSQEYRCRWLQVTYFRGGCVWVMVRCFSSQTVTETCELESDLKQGLESSVCGERGHAGARRWDWGTRFKFPALILFVGTMRSFIIIPFPHRKWPHLLAASLFFTSRKLPVTDGRFQLNDILIIWQHLLPFNVHSKT